MSNSTHSSSLCDLARLLNPISVVFESPRTHRYLKLDIPSTPYRMSFDASKYESQIRAILQAPGVDLGTISAKRVRKHLLELNDDLTPEIVKEHKEELDALIGTVYEQVSADVGEDADGGASAAEENGKRKREYDEAVGVPSSPSSPKKAKKVQRTQSKTDEQLARQLEQQLNGRERPTRAAASKPMKSKRAKKNAKTAGTVEPGGEGVEGEKKKKGGFAKQYTLRYVVSCVCERQ